MTEKISPEKIVEPFTRALIDDCREFIELFPNKILKHDVLKDSGFPEKLDIESEKNFTIFILVLELFSLPNIFEKNLAGRLKELSLNSFCSQMNYDKELLLKEVKEYEDRWREDISVGIDPFDSLGVMAILCEKLKCKKTVEVGEIKSFSPFLTTVLGTYITSLIGRWKKLNNIHEFM